MAVCYCRVHARALTEHHERWIDVLRLHILPLEDLSTWLDNGNIEASEYAVLETRCNVCDQGAPPLASPGHTQQDGSYGHVIRAR